MKVPCAPPASCLQLSSHCTALASMLLKTRPWHWAFHQRPSNQARVYGAPTLDRVAHARSPLSPCQVGVYSPYWTEVETEGQ